MSGIRERWVIVGRSPTSNARMYYTVAGTLATRGRSKKFASIDRAFKRAHKLLREHPEVRKYHLFAEKLREPGDSGRIRTLKNPSASGYSRAVKGYTDELDKAADAYEAFTGATATHLTRYKKPATRAGFALGKLLAVEYRATRDGETNTFRHDFKKSSQPLLVGSDDGSSLDIVGGRIRVTEKGIEDT